MLVQKLTNILEMQLADNVNAREMQPDGSYQKVKPAPGEPLVNSQMGMYELLKDDWTGGRPAAAAAVKTAEPNPVQAKVVVRPAAPAAPAAPVAQEVKPAPQPVAAEPQPAASAAEAPKPAETVVVVKEQPQGGLFSRLRRALFGGRK